MFAYAFAERQAVQPANANAGTQPSGSRGASPQAEGCVSGDRDVETVVLRNYLQQALTASKLPDLTALARRAGLQPSTLSRWWKKEADRTAPHGGTLRLLEEASGVTLPPELARFAGRSGFAEVQARTPAAPANLPVPVHALIGTRFDGLFFRNHAASEHVRRLPGLEGRSAVFALRMPDDSMEPWRRPNELVFVDPTWAVGIGDHALLEIANHHDPDGPPLYMIRRLVARERRTGNIRLGRYAVDGPQTDSVKATTVTAIHRVLEWSEAAYG